MDGWMDVWMDDLTVNPNMSCHIKPFWDDKLDV